MSTLSTITSPSSFWPMNFEPGHPAGLLEKKTAVLNYIAQSERLVTVRSASRLEVRPKPEMISTGIAELDALAGGIPRGCLTEICGSASSGKTSALLAAVAAATQCGEPCVLIDASDSFNPSSGAAAGLDFSKLLWVRCGKKNPSYVARHLSFAENQSSVTGRASSAKKQRHRVPHPTACPELVEGRFSLGGDFDFADDLRRTTNDGFSDDRRPTTDDPKRIRKSHERRLEHVLKSTDLILQSGGFGLVALDLAGIPEKFVRRIPLASWFRFQRAVEHTKTALLVISEFPCAQTCASLILNVRSKPSVISRQPSGKPTHAEVLKELRVEAEILRSRLVHNGDRKPMQSVKASFSTHAVRAG
jgi:recombination protein RecA